MSTKIGIVSEGVSDYQILKHIVGRYLKEYDPNVIALKPKITNQWKQQGYGTWQGVFEYIEGNDKLILEAVNEGCEFVIIQIDTDVSNEYKVTNDLTDIDAFWSSVKEGLLQSVHSDFPLDKLVFAICIQEIECWLIPFNKSVNEKECVNTNSCLNILNKHIRTLGTIDKDNKNSQQAQKLYQLILKEKRKPKEIADCARYNYGFRKFIEQLDEMKSKI